MFHDFQMQHCLPEALHEERPRGSLLPFAGEILKARELGELGILQVERRCAGLRLRLQPLIKVYSSNTAKQADKGSKTVEQALVSIFKRFT